MNRSAAEQIIHEFVTSRLNNGNALFYSLPQNQISRLQHIQNTAARVVTLKELHWLPVSHFKLMLIVHKSFNNIAPIYISELQNDRSFSVAAPRFWNHLPTKLKSCHRYN